MGKLGLYIEELNERTTKNNQYEVLTSSQDGIISQKDYFNKQIASVDNTGYKIIKKGQYTYRSMSDTGRFYINQLKDKDIGIVSPAYPVFKIIDKNVNPDFLGLFFQSNSFQKQLSDKAAGSTRLALRYSKLENVQVKIPSSKIQSSIVKNINHIKYSLEIEERELNLLDELIKSRFNEMFSTEKNKCQLIDACLGKPEYGAQSAASKYNYKRPRYIRITDINDDGTLNSDKVSSSNINDDKNYLLHYGDFLFARMGATVGKTYLGRDNNEIFAGYLIRFKLDLNKMLPEYLYWYTKTNEYWEWVNLKQSGAAQPGINAQKYSSMVIPFPCLTKQKSFLDFVNQVDKLKFNVQQRIDKYKELLNKKMDEYFN